METWKPIYDFLGLYEVSDLGRIRSLDRIIVNSNGKHLRHRGRIIKQFVSNNGYMHVTLMNIKTIRVHRLVANAFIPLIEGKNVINHKNSIRTDNRVENLEWCTQSENLIHGFRSPLRKPRNFPTGPKHHNYKTGLTSKTDIIKSCAVCGKEFTPRFFKGIVCSLQCRGKYNSKSLYYPSEQSTLSIV